MPEVSLPLDLLPDPGKSSDLDPISMSGPKYVIIVSDKPAIGFFDALLDVILTFKNTSTCNETFTHTVHTPLITKVRTSALTDDTFDPACKTQSMVFVGDDALPQGNTILMSATGKVISKNNPASS